MQSSFKRANQVSAAGCDHILVGGDQIRDLKDTCFREAPFKDFPLPIFNDLAVLADLQISCIFSIINLIKLLSLAFVKLSCC